MRVKVIVPIATAKGELPVGKILNMQDHLFTRFTGYVEEVPALSGGVEAITADAYALTLPPEGHGIYRLADYCSNATNNATTVPKPQPQLTVLNTTLPLNIEPRTECRACGHPVFRQGVGSHRSCARCHVPEFSAGLVPRIQQYRNQKAASSHQCRKENAAQNYQPAESD